MNVNGQVQLVLTNHVEMLMILQVMMMIQNVKVFLSCVQFNKRNVLLKKLHVWTIKIKLLVKNILFKELNNVLGQVVLVLMQVEHLIAL